jgi:transcriptional regulator with XRE-family HTH domain
MFKPLTAAKLRQSEVAKLVGVHRSTVCLWMNGHSSPHPYIADRVHKLLDAVRQCVDTEDLPAPRSIGPRERGDYIRKALERHGWKQTITS